MRYTTAFLLCLGLGVLGCTRFSFPQNPGTAPSDLMDRGRMIRLEAGTFSMGDAQGEVHEYPVHAVELSAFFIDATEVTNHDFRRCVDEGVCRASREMSDPNLNQDDQPVVGGTWNDARSYCQWVGKRLPTEAEWERAARGLDARRYPFEGSWDLKKANIRGASDGFVYSSPVKSFPAGATPEGGYDFAGNAAEWVSDWFDPVFYRDGPTRDPKGPSSSTRSKSIRGGSWSGNAYEARAAARDAMDPAFSKNSIGFRCAASVTAR